MHCVHSAREGMCDSVKKLVFVEWLVFFGAASQSRRGAVTMADLCSQNSAQTETPTHVKCHSTNLFPMQPRYNCRGERQTHLIAPQNEFTRRLCNLQIHRLYFYKIQTCDDVFFLFFLVGCLLVLGMLGSTCVMQQFMFLTNKRAMYLWYYPALQPYFNLLELTIMCVAILSTHIYHSKRVLFSKV